MANICDNSVTFTDFTEEFRALVFCAVNKDNFFEVLYPVEEDRRTAWGAFLDEVFESSFTDDEIFISFTTKWQPPIELYEWLRETYGCSIKATYEESGMDFAGIWQDGEDRQIQMSDVEAYCELFGSDHPDYDCLCPVKDGKVYNDNGEVIGITVSKYKWLPLGEQELYNCQTGYDNNIYCSTFDLEELGLDD